jgi:hypothetical protein
VHVENVMSLGSVNVAVAVLLSSPVHSSVSTTIAVCLLR